MNSYTFSFDAINPLLFASQMFNRGYDVSIKHSKNNPSQDDHVIVEAYLPTPNEWIIFVSQIREYYDPLMTKEELLNLHLF